MRYILPVLFLFSFHFSSAQFEGRNVLPVKIDKKWGLINTNGTLVMEPKYDLIGERFGGAQFVGGFFSAVYVTVQLDDQIGLINMQGQEILPPIFDEVIDAFSDSVFTVKKNNQLLVVNYKGETVFDGKYEEVIPIPRDSEHFIVKENGKYGLIKKGQGYIIPNKYHNLSINKIRQPFLNFQTERSAELEQVGLISFENKIIFPAEYDFITIVSRNHFLIKKDFYEIRNAKQQVLISETEEWTDARPLSKSFIALHSSFKKESKIYSLKIDNYIQTKTKYDGFKKFNNNFLLGRKDGKVGLIDTLGNEVIPPNFKKIVHMEGDTLFKVQRFQWGIFNVRQGLITPTEYDDVSQFGDSFAEVINHQKRGLVNRKGEVVTPVQFEHFQFQDEFVKAFQGQKMNYYEMDDNERLTLTNSS